jgi:ABC-type oligopeptide transport system ATPase subunit
METNARKSTIEAAVKRISEKYKGNIIFQRKPTRTTKTNWKFTIRTLDKLALPSRKSAKGRPVYKASWQAHGEIMEEIFRMEHGRTDDRDRPIFIKTAIPNPLAEDGLFREGFKWVDVDISLEDQDEEVLYSQTAHKKALKAA